MLPRFKNSRLNVVKVQKMSVESCQGSKKVGMFFPETTRRYKTSRNNAYFSPKILQENSCNDFINIFLSVLFWFPDLALCYGDIERKTLLRAPAFSIKSELFNYCSVRLNIRKIVPKSSLLFHSPETMQRSFLQWVN